MTTAGTAAAEPATNACPNGFETITVAQAEAEGYFPVPVIVDTSFGNGDGVVCRRALGDGVLRSFPEPPAVDQIYFWLDNSTPR